MPIGKDDPTTRVDAIDGPKVPQKRICSVLRVEVRRDGRCTDQLVELAEMITPVRRRHELSAGSKNVGELLERTIEVRDMEEHPRRDRAIERSVAEIQPLHVAEPRVDSARRGDLDHALGLIQGDDLGAELAGHPLGELTFPAPDLEDSARLSISNSSEEDFASVWPLAGLVSAFSYGQSRLVRVLLADVARIVQRHGSTIGAPGIPRFGAFPPSHLFTVAPTSANSPSCT